MSPIGRKVFGLGPLHVPLAYSLALHHRARHPRRRLFPRLAWSRKSTSLASLLPRSSASAYGGSVDFRSHCTSSSSFLARIGLAHPISAQSTHDSPHTAPSRISANISAIF